jgi:uncharacterized protein
MIGDERDAIREVLGLQVWAVVGCSPDSSRDSHRVASFLLDRGKVVVPVNPACDEILGQRCYADLASIPDDVGVEVVDCFRRSDQVGAHVDQAIERGAAAVWLQLGVLDEEAVARARAAGLLAIVDRCPLIEWPRVMR